MPRFNDSFDRSYADDNFTIEDMLGNSPGWLLQSGTGVLFAFTFLTVVMSWFIRYPDKLEGMAMIQTERPPVEVVPGISATIDQLLAYQGQEVNAGTPIAILESGAIWSDINTLEQWLDQVEGKPIAKHICPPKIRSGRFGPVSPAFNSYLQAVKAWQQINNDPRIPQTIASLTDERKHLQELFSSLEKQETVYEEEYRLLEKDLQRAKILKASQTISELDWEQKQNILLQGKQQIERYQTQKIQNRLSQDKLAANIQKSIQDQRQQLLEQEQVIVAALDALQQKLSDWQQQFILRAPASGSLNWSSGIVQGSYANAGGSIGKISPSEEENPVVIRCWLPAPGIGRLEIGNKVQMQLDKYPHQEFGELEGELSHIASLPDLKGEAQVPMYELTARVDTPLLTNYRKTIAFQQNSPGRVMVITKERRLLLRFLDKIKSQMN